VLSLGIKKTWSPV